MRVGNFSRFAFATGMKAGLFRSGAFLRHFRSCKHAKPIALQMLSRSAERLPKTNTLEWSERRCPRAVLQNRCRGRLETGEAAGGGMMLVAETGGVSPAPASAGKAER